MSKNLEYKERERQRKRESRWQASEARREKDWEIKNKGDIFCWKNHISENFVAAVRKWEMLAATTVKMRAMK